MQTTGQAVSIDPPDFELLKSLFRGMSEGELLRVAEHAEAAHRASYAEWARRDLHLEPDPESKGYAPLLIANGVEPAQAEKLARDAIRYGRQTAQNGDWIAAVYGAIRFLASRQSRRMVERRAKLLLDASKETSVISLLFAKAGLDQDEFLRLLYRVAYREGLVNLDRLRAIASQLRPFLSLSRGRKVTAASAAHEYMMRLGLSFATVPAEWRTNWRKRGNEHVDPLTRATRFEFDQADFKSRSARLRWSHRQSDCERAGPNMSHK
jgi:hypothetical protein